ncbi:MAG: hypothetical protein B6D44_08280 [Ignavibacteriales bacterium UTCHB2]|nr:MAG: hypothetical protein BWY38_01260 [Ignavibacteria bacterium ADurb.Bin266]OQY73069.1 MAG: hypothetical protein B6D44_08280 [Ignavibacteriales bacterium UTCHB2]HQI40114.1 hypothetical protein [Ignavibacteriaceae bacterium]HQJ45526.1 hypothetical protein [Ignavibacteriaceae bacterium]
MNIQKKISFFIILILFASVELNAQTRIAVLYSEFSQKSFYSDTNNYLDEFTAWEIFLMQNKIKYKVIYDEDLDSDLADDFDILILPRYNIQSTEKYSVIKNFLLSGKSVLSVNSFNSTLSSINTNELKDLFGITLKNEIFNNNLSFTQTIFASPINSFKSPASFLVSAKGKNQYVDLKRFNYSAAGFVLGTDVNSEVSSIVYGYNNSGRFVFIGYGLTDLIGGSEEYKNFELFLLDALKWLNTEVDAFPYLTINKKEQFKLLLVQYNNALSKDFIDVLIQNDFNPHILINETSQLEKIPLEKISEDQIILDLRAFNQGNKNQNIIEYLRSFEMLGELKIKSVFITSNFATSLINQIKEYGVNNFIFSDKEITGTQLNNDKSLFIFFNPAEQSLKNNSIEIIYFLPKIDCNKDIENDFLIDLKNKVNDRTVFTDISSLRDKLMLERKIKIRVQKNQNVEINVINDNLVEIKDLILFVKIDDFNIVTDSRKSILSYTTDQRNGMKKIFINKIFPRSEEKVIFNSGR